ncbi:hypothetical protein AR158_c141R [Paramecium bursaria Chlorella virus AR158]|uniref:hypothetical protein n=1 Tax=Paramecium bursaria Chlorella virus AR158 TaxID=380598 RepID=UPI00015AA7EC|nr:hypothetical protein AR158_c141R [Paramecium bursaria Chlorella virus AR158]ABU43687.1 hypothetical protein AR158_c141R [Paramecium bursaria Chlorella virus AR158]
MTKLISRVSSIAKKASDASYIFFPAKFLLIFANNINKFVASNCLSNSKFDQYIFAICESSIEKKCAFFLFCTSILSNISCRNIFAICGIWSII